VEEIDGVGLQHLAVMHQAPHLVGRGRDLVHACHDIHRLGGAQMMADRADAAESLDNDGNFPVQPSLDEALEAPELHDMKPRLFDLAGLVETNRDLAVTLDAGDRIDDDFAWTAAELHVAHSYLHSR
jgi:hypothetical protein